MKLSVLLLALFALLPVLARAADPVHYSYISAAYILEKLKRTQGLAQSKSYWTFSDIFEEAPPHKR